MPTFTARSSFRPRAVRGLPKAIELMARREKVILDRARAPGFNARAMREALREAGEIH